MRWSKTLGAGLLTIFMALSPLVVAADSGKHKGWQQHHKHEKHGHQHHHKHKHYHHHAEKPVIVERPVVIERPVIVERPVITLYPAPRPPRPHVDINIGF